MQRSPTLDSTRSPAEIYDEFFVPALFRHWGPVVGAAAGVAPGHAVLDVGCGTGALTLAVADMVRPGGMVVGLDPNPEMLTVARRQPADVTWVEGRAEALPLEDESFDAVVSQFAMMFFKDRPLAFREMMRVLKPGGRMAVAVCDGLDRSDGYAAFADLLRRLFGQEVASAFASPFVLGDTELLRRICVEAGLSDARIDRHQGEVSFDSIASMVSTERACVWTLGGVLDDAQFEQLLIEATDALQPFKTAEGRMSFSMPALIISAAKAP